MKKLLLYLLKRELEYQIKENNKELGECGRHEEIVVPIQRVIAYLSE